MDGFNEKKWFVYINDHHEGPFSLAEIQAKLAESQVTPTSYVWAEGLADWKAMNEVPEFDTLVKGGGAPAAAGAEPGPDVTTFTPPMVEVEKTGDLDPTDLHRAKESSLQLESIPVHGASPKRAAPAAASAPAASKAERGSSSRLIKLTVAVGIPAALVALYFGGQLDPLTKSPGMQAGLRTVQDFAQPHLLKLSEKIPALAKWVSPIPALDDVSEDEYEALKAAAMPKLEEAGPKIAIALSRADLMAPSFYVASNLPDGAVIDVYVEGIPDTLLNQLSFSAKVQATISKKHGKTGAVRSADGKPMPRGEYLVYVTEAAEQPEPAKTALANVPPVTAKVPPMLPRGLKLLVSKPYFLGGGKDAAYDSRLKEFHDKLRAKASTELAEIKQFASTLESQLNETVAKFTQLRASSRKGKIAPAARQAWAKFHEGWMKSNDAFRESYAKWTPEALAAEYFYGPLYALTQKAGQAIQEVHELQQAFIEGRVEPKSFDIQLGTANSGAQSALAALRAKIEQAEKLAPTPNGMPRREGL